MSCGTAPALVLLFSDQLKSRSPWSHEARRCRSPRKMRKKNFFLEQNSAGKHTRVPRKNNRRRRTHEMKSTYILSLYKLTININNMPASITSTTDSEFPAFPQLTNTYKAIDYSSFCCLECCLYPTERTVVVSTERNTPAVVYGRMTLVPIWPEIYSPFDNEIDFERGIIFPARVVKNKVRVQVGPFVHLFHTTAYTK